MKNVLMVDIDDTLAETQSAIIEYVNERSAKQYTFENVTREMREQDDHPYNEMVRDFLRLPDLIAAIRPVDGALEAARRLAEAGYELHTVSSRKENLHETTIGWLAANGFTPYISAVHGRPSKQRGYDFKMEMARRTGAVAAFDDTYEVALALSGLEMGVYLIDKPWNASEDLARGMRRVESFAAGAEEFLAGR